MLILGVGKGSDNQAAYEMTEFVEKLIVSSLLHRPACQVADSPGCSKLVLTSQVIDPAIPVMQMTFP